MPGDSNVHCVVHRTHILNGHSRCTHQFLKIDKKRKNNEALINHCIKFGGRNSFGHPQCFCEKYNFVDNLCAYQQINCIPKKLFTLLSRVESIPSSLHNIYNKKNVKTTLDFFFGICTEVINEMIILAILRNIITKVHRTKHHCPSIKDCPPCPLYWKISSR